MEMKRGSDGHRDGQRDGDGQMDGKTDLTCQFCSKRLVSCCCCFMISNNTDCRIITIIIIIKQAFTQELWSLQLQHRLFSDSLRFHGEQSGSTGVSRCSPVWTETRTRREELHLTGKPTANLEGHLQASAAEEAHALNGPGVN